MRISFRLALALLMVICGIFSVHAYLSVRFHERLYATDVQRDHHVMARGLAPAAAALWRSDGAEAARRLLEDANEREIQTQVRWVFTDRRREEPQAPDLPADDLDRLRAGEEVTSESATRILLYFPVTIGAEVVGAIELSEPLEIRAQYVRERIAWAVAAAIAMIVVGGLLSFSLGNRLVGTPVRLLMESARRIGSGDFRGSAYVGAKGEFSELASEMNAMAEQLAAARARVEHESQARITALEQLRHADRLTTVGRLAAGIAHELGTPLNVISERAKMIVRGEAETRTEVVESARVVHDQARRMTGIVRQLLDFARRGSPERSLTDLVELTRSTIKLVQPVLGRPGISIGFHPRGDPVIVSVDPNQIQQALINLLTNAVDVSPQDGEVEIHLERIAARADADRGAGSLVALTVRDRGPGIPDQVLHQIFDPFFTTKRVGEGTGLGLSVAQGIVRDHDGRIEVETGPHETRFRILLHEA